MPQPVWSAAMTAVPVPKRRRAWLAIPLLALILSVMIGFLPIFHLETVHFPDELRSVTQEELLNASGLVKGQHLLIGLGGTLDQWLHLRYGQAEEKLLGRFPAIKSVEIRMQFPGAVRMLVEERVEVAYLAIPDGCVMIDKEGYALKILADPPANIPVIEGVGVTTMTLGQPLTVDVPAAMNSAITLMGAIIEADRDTRPVTPLLPQISKIRPLSGRQLYLTVIIPDTGEELTVVAETGQDQTDDMLWLRFALDQDVLNGRGKGILDLTGSRRTFTPD
ncbi:MAG: FtsQ-type POTRA domain-containing protein [Clostridiaceae bacterium]|nr:FtsQ-type POTRA domain-containing protein [Clostridiaceae bacterium]